MPPSETIRRPHAKLGAKSRVFTSMHERALGLAHALAPGARGTSGRVHLRAAVDIAMERYAGGDDAAFATVYDVLAPRLYGYLLRQAKDRTRAEDLLQQTMLHIHRARIRFIPGAEVNALGVCDRQATLSGWAAPGQAGSLSGRGRSRLGSVQ